MVSLGESKNIKKYRSIFREEIWSPLFFKEINRNSHFDSKGHKNYVIPFSQKGWKMEIHQLKFSTGSLILTCDIDHHLLPLH